MSAESINFIESITYSCGDIKISDIDKLSKKIDRFKKDGVNNLKVVTDFDMTITKCHVPAGFGHSSHAMFECYSKFPAEFREKQKILLKKYMPIERDFTLSHEERLKAVIEWWNLSHGAIIDLNINKNDLPDIIDEGYSTGRYVIRPGVKEFLNHCFSENIPVTIMSAGLQTIIEYMMVREGYPQVQNDHSKLSLVANNLIFDDNTGFLTDFGPLVHPFSKKDALEAYLHTDPSRKNRLNSICMGDMLHDAKVMHGIDSNGEEILIGFLNNLQASEQEVQVYLENFDIVVMKDGSMDVAEKLVKYVIGS